MIKELLVICLSAVIGAYIICVSVAGVTARASSPTFKRYEYHFVECSSDRVLCQKTLNKRGSEGWRVHSQVLDSGYTSLLVMEREAQ